MNRILIFIITLTLAHNISLKSQEYHTSVLNPFGINIDTTGGLAVYTCNFADIDNDGDIDIIYPYTNEDFRFAYQENIGTSSSPNFKPIEKMDIILEKSNGFLIPDFADINNDGLTDFIAFGQAVDSTGFNCTYYENKGNNDFEIVAGPSIGIPGVGYTIGLPEIVDLNQDGDYDLILSGAELEAFTDEPDGIFYYAQNSDSHDPRFTGWFIEPYSIEFMDTFQFVIIRSGDLDLDGDIDFLMNVSINDNESRFMFQENISPPNEKSDFSGPQVVSPFGLPENTDGIHFLEDMDGDGDLDLLIYEELSILYYENTSCINSNTSLSVSTCDEVTYTLNDISYSSSGTYSQVIPNNAGCDSIITLNLSFNSSINSDFEISICEGGSYVWEGEEFSIAGEYDKFLKRGNGCDSVVTLMLNINSELRSTFEDSFCSGDEYSWNGNTYTEAGNFEQTFVSGSGCDSIVTLTLDVLTFDYEISTEENRLSVEVENADFSWINCDNNLEIEGEHQSVFIPTESGSFAAILTQGECEMMTECYSFTITNTDELSISEILVFPNPAKNFILVQGQAINQSDTEVEIINSAGNIFFRKMSKNKIEVSDLASGIYYLYLNIESNLIIKPFVIFR